MGIFIADFIMKTFFYDAFKKSQNKTKEYDRIDRRNILNEDI